MLQQQPDLDGIHVEELRGRRQRRVAGAVEDLLQDGDERLVLVGQVRTLAELRELGRDASDLAAGDGLSDEGGEPATRLVVLTPRPAVGEEGRDGVVAGARGGRGVADGAFEVVEDAEGLPRLCRVAVGFVAFDRPQDLLAGLVVALQRTASSKRPIDR